MPTEAFAKLKLVSSRVQGGRADEDSPAKQRRPGTAGKSLKSERHTSEQPGKYRWSKQLPKKGHGRDS